MAAFSVFNVTYTCTLTHACAYVRTHATPSSSCSHSDPWLGESLSMLLPHLPILRYPLPDGTLPEVVYFVSPPSRRSSSSSFPFVGFPGSDMQCPSVISYPADVPCPGPLPSSDLFNHVCNLCVFSYPHGCFCPGTGI